MNRRVLIQLLFPVKRRRSLWWRCPHCNVLADANTDLARKHKC